MTEPNVRGTRVSNESKITRSCMQSLQTERKSISRIMKWRPIDRAMAPSNHLLQYGGITSRDWFSEMLQHARDTIQLKL